MSMDSSFSQYRAEDALLGRHARRLLRAGSWQYDPEHGTVHVDESTQTILGVENDLLSLDSLLGRIVSDNRFAFASALETEATVDCYLTFERPDGELRDLHICGESVQAADGPASGVDPTTDGKPDSTNCEPAETDDYHVQGVIRDVTDDPESADETKQVVDDGVKPIDNQETSASKRDDSSSTITRSPGLFRDQLESVLEQADLAFWQWNLQTNDVWGTDRWLESLPVEHERRIIDRDDWLTCVHPADRETVRDVVESRFEPDSRDIWSVEYRIETDGGEWRWRETLGKVIERNEDGRATHAVGIVHEIDDRKAARRQLEEERDMFAAGPAVVFRWRNEPGWPMEYVSANVMNLLEYTPTELRTDGIAYEQLTHPDDRERIRNEVSDASDSGLEYFEHEPYRLLTKSGDVRWVLDYTKIHRNDDGDITHFIGYLVDITDQKRQERRREALNEAAHHLVGLQSSSEVFEILRKSIRDLFDAEWVLTYRYDSDRGALVPTTEDTRDDHVIEPGDHPLWEVYVTGEQMDLDSQELPVSIPAESSTTLSTDSAHRTVTAFPLGEHGVCLRCTTTDETTEFEELLTTMAGIALDRVEETAQRMSRVEKMRERTKNLESRTKLYRTACSLVPALVETTSRQDAYRTVCETLVSTDAFDGAWIGVPGSDELTPIAQASLPSQFLDDHPLELDASTPVARASRKREVVQCPQISEHIQREPWRAGALACDLRSALAVPIEHEDVHNGTLVVYDSSTGTFDDEVCDLLADLGAITSYLLNLRARFEAIRGETTVELTFDVEFDESSPLVTLARRHENPVIVENLAPGQPNSWLTHCRVDDASALTGLDEEVTGVERIEPLDDERVEILVIDDKSLAAVGNLGAECKSLQITGDVGTLVVTVAQDQRVQPLTSTLEDRFESVSLEAKSHTDVTDETAGETALAAALTDRQKTILQTAYFSGYFDSDRKRTGADIADTLGISQPTFSNHLRAALRNLLGTMWQSAASE